MPDVRELDANLWVADRRLNLYGLRIGARMTVIRLADGGLFLHSPVELDAPTRAQLETLGPVRFVAAPSKVHHIYVAACRSAYPDALYYAAPGLAEKRRDLCFDGVLGDEAPAAWKGQIEQTVFAGVSHTNEVVFFHPESRTLVLTDLAFNVVETDSLVTKILLWLVGAGGPHRFGPTRLMRAIIRDHEAARASLETILAWDFDRVIVSHGVVLQHAGKRKLREAFAFLTP